VIPFKEFNSLEFVPVYFKPKASGRDQLRFLPKCSGCGKVLVDISAANIAVVEGDPCRLRRIGMHKQFELFRQTGRALVFCWKCDSKQGGNVPWQNALGTFRAIDEPQLFPEPIRKKGKR
jgi:hypothetical protein